MERLERKFGKYAIKNLMLHIMILNVRAVGIVLKLKPPLMTWIRYSVHNVRGKA